MDTYKNPFESISKRVEDLLSQMTLEEKIAELNLVLYCLSHLKKILICHLFL